MTARTGDRITDVAGITVGHDHRLGDGWATGTTVLRISTPPDRSAPPTVAVDVRGGGPGTRETDLLDPSNTVQTAHAIVLTGGSAYGLAAADGVMLALEQQGVGLPMDDAGHVVPIVPAAVIFDLPVGEWHNRPDAGFGARALSNAAADFAVGSVGAGTGARAGALKGGVGTSSIRIDDGPAAGITVGALMVANPVGMVIDPVTGLPWGVTAADVDHHGLRAPSSSEIAALADLEAKRTVLNTTIGVVATDAALSTSSLRRVAMAAHDGLARAIQPAHSPLDGDTVFAVATGRTAPAHNAVTVPIPPGMNPEVAVLAEVCRVAAEVTRRAVVDAVLAATPVDDEIPSYAQVLPSAIGRVGRNRE